MDIMILFICGLYLLGASDYKIENINRTVLIFGGATIVAFIIERLLRAIK